MLAVLGSQAIGFFLIPIYTRYLTPADYGVLEILQTTLGIIAPIIGMGLGTALFYFFSNCETDEGKKELISTVLIFLAVTSSGVLLALMLGSSSFSSLLFHSDQYTFYFRVMFLTLFLGPLEGIPMSVFRARGESRKYALFSLARFIVTTGLYIYFIVGLHMGVLGILLGGLLTSAIFCAILLPQITRGLKPRFSKSLIKEMLGYGLPLVPVAFLAWIIAASDRYFLQIFCDSTEVGLYSLGYRFGGVLHGLVLGPFQLAWMPFLFSIRQERNAKEIYASVLTYFTVIATFVALALSILSKEVLMVMATPPFYSAYRVVPLIALSYLFYGCFMCVNMGMYLEKKTKYIPFIVGAGAALNLGLNYLLIPTYGMMGAAIATAASYLLMLVVAFFAAQRYYPVRYEWSRIGRIFLAAGLVYAGSFFITNDSPIIAGVLKALTLLGFPALLFAFRFFKPEEITKAKELLKMAPGYIKMRITQSRFFRRR
jgi:O-antigen/teichoic acid export membrane protein